MTAVSATLASVSLADSTLPTFIEVAADNRGFISLRANCPLDETTITSTSVRVLTAGGDGSFRTADDVVRISDITYVPGTNTIEIDADIPLDSQYSVLVRGDLVRSADGALIDGEFNGVGVATGDGQAGGDFEIFTRPPARQIVRFTTRGFRTIDVELFTNDTPLTVANFIDYANDGVWDGTFFHRSVPGFVIQGGGFLAVPGFDDAEQRSSVLNEPGISNLRGTIAMAKLGNDPNSATNQWFFNLVDNSSNLDSTNGGFTVFGEIVSNAGLTIIDSIADLEIVNAVNENSAFTDLPVLDGSVFSSRGSLAVDDLVIIDRVSILQDISSDPVITFNMDNAQVMDGGGNASVMVFDVQGDPLPADSLTVSFTSNGNIVRAVTLNDNIPAGSEIAISIDSAAPILSISDRRRDPSDIMFIHSNRGISSIKLNAGIEGANINGVTLPDGTVLATDIDGDGSGGDNIAILLQSGTVNRIDIRGDVNGDMIIPDGCADVRVKGDITDCTMQFGSSEGMTALNVRAERAENLRIDTSMRLNQLLLSEMTSTSDISPSDIRCASIGRITTIGLRGTDVAGDFEADITTTSSGSALSMFQLRVAGRISDSTMVFDSGIGRIDSRDDIIDSSIGVNGSFNGGLKAREIRRTDINVNGPMGILQADQIRAGSLTADSVRQIRVGGNRREDLDGTFSMDVTISNPDGLRSACSLIQVASDMIDSDISIQGSTASVRIGGNVENVNYFQNGDLGQWTAKRMDTVDLEIEGNSRRIAVTDWTGGFLEVDNLDRYDILGDRRNDIQGDLDAGALIRRLGTMRVMNGGTLSQSLNIFDCKSIEIDGDLVNSLVQFNNFANQGQDEVFVANSVKVKGTLFDSFIRTRGSIRTIQFGGMENSGVILGAPVLDVFEFPPLPENVNITSNLGSISVVGDPATPRFVNSLIIAADIDNITITEPSTVNGSPDHGISYTTLTGTIRIRVNGEIETLDQRDGTVTFGDFQIRSFHQAPVIP